MNCAAGFDADMVMRAVRGELAEGARAEFERHLDACARCRASIRAATIVRETWSGALLADETARETASVRRLVARPLPARRPWRSMVLAAAAAAIVTAAYARMHPRVEYVERVPSVAPAHVVPSAPVPGASTSAPGTPSTPPSVDRVLVARACTACGEDVSPGAPLTNEVAVPRGATLLLAFEVDGRWVEAGEAIEVTGPARVLPAEEAGEAAIELARGTLHASMRSAGVVRTPHARTRGAGARWVVDVREERTRIRVLAGVVEISARGGRDEPLVLSATDTPNEVDFGPEGILPSRTASKSAPGASTSHHDARATVPETPPTDVPLSLPGATVPTDAERLADARRAIAEGRVADAERLLNALAASSDPQTRERAEFAHAELEIGRGAIDAARARLYPLTRSSDPPLAGDAVFLLTRTFTSAADRAELLRRYLEGPAVSSPYREQAMLERGEALLASGDRGGATAMVDALASLPALPSTIARRLALLRARLRDAPAPTR